MRRPPFDLAWNDDCKMAYHYDLEEVFGEISVYGYAYAYAERQREAIELLRSVVTPPASVLDVAAGSGNFSLLLAEAGYRVTWNDLRGGLVDYVRLKHEHGEVQYQPGNAFELGFEKAFDAVLILEIIEHVAHPDEFLRQVARMVKPGGYVVMTTPNGAYLRNNLPKFSDCTDASRFEAVQFKPNADGHIFLLHEDEVPTLARQAGLTVARMRFGISLLTNGHLKTERLLKAAPRAVIEGLEQITRRLPRFLQRKVNTSLSVLLHKPA